MCQKELFPRSACQSVYIHSLVGIDNPKLHAHSLINMALITKTKFKHMDCNVLREECYPD